MKKTIVYSALLITLTFISLHCQSNTIKTSSPDRLTTLADVVENFKDVPNAYKTVPFWVWHDKVTKQEIDIQLEDFKNQGFGGVFIHPRYGLVTEYLSEEWFELIKYAVDKAKSIGINAWLYDENSFPSGFAGGHVPANMPESANQGQGLSMNMFKSLPDSAGIKYKYILKKEVDGFSIVSDPAAEMGKTGDYYGFKVLYYGRDKWHAGYSYVDLIYPGVTEKFIEITMTGYEKSIGAEFGKTVPGIFTDEPNIATPSGKNCIRWTPDLFEQFTKRWGYDLQPNLVSLYEETGDWQKTRHNYYATLLELFIDRWSKPWYNYTEKHNLNWTGHYWEHGWPSPHHGGDNMAMYAWHQVPSIDMLFNTFSLDGVQFGNVRAVKELSSVANQLDRHRTLSETYGAAGWELTFQDMKRLGDWEYVMGVNLMNQHLGYMTLEGDRKHDFPQSFSYHEPWWGDYKILADYYARLSLALSSGYQVNSTLIIEPTTTAWMYYSSIQSNPKMDNLEKSFRKFLNTLENQQIEYDLGCENIMRDQGAVKDGKLYVGKSSYSLVILPPGLDNLDKSTFELLEKYLAAGGQVVCYNTKPEFIDGQNTRQIEELADKYTQNWITFTSIDEKFLELLKSDNFAITTDKNNDLLFHQRRTMKDGELLFLVNSSLDKSSSGKIKINGAFVQELNALTGEITAKSAELVDGKLLISFTLPPANSLLLAVNSKGSPNTEKQAMREKTIVETTQPLVIKPSGPNMFTLDYCTVETGGQIYKNVYFYTGSFKIFQAHGFADNPWVSSSQFKTELIDKNNFGPDTGFKATYPFYIKSAFNTQELKAVVERPDIFNVSVNGLPLDPIPDVWAIDRSFAVYNIGDIVQQGENSLTITCIPMSIFAELETVYLMGDFHLQSAAHGWEMVPSAPLKPGNWNEQGLPFYPNGVMYTKTYQLNKDRHYSVQLGDWYGSLARILVNGKPAGIIGWQPYQLDISDYITDGANDITVEIIGTLKNLLGPHHNVRERGIVTPWSFKYAPDVQPKGKDYDLLDYGLKSDLAIYEMK